MTEDSLSQQQIARALTGDRAAVSALVQLQLGRVYRLCLRISNSRELAEEATQETFVRVLRDLDQLRDHARLTGWVLTIAANTVRGLLRRKPREVQLDHDPPAAPTEASGPVELQQQALAHAVARLQSSDRELFLLHHIEGLPLTDLARSHATSTPAIKSRMHRIRERVRASAGAYLTEQELPSGVQR